MVYTVNNPLTYVMSSAKFNATGLRWVAELPDYNFTIKYQPGGTNINADYLYRIALDMNTHMGTYTEELSTDVLRATTEAVREQSHCRIPWITAVTVDMTTSEPTLQNVKLKPLGTQEIKEAQRLDVLINLVTHYKSIGVKPYGKHWCVTPPVLIIFYVNGT